ncbi:MAG: hypothetical protein IJ173_00865, partial [Kiritimatiellae bacterium]|nr:hypothetical protein [Kiritimatiellia bacterium]
MEAIITIEWTMVGEYLSFFGRRKHHAREDDWTSAVGHTFRERAAISAFAHVDALKRANLPPRKFTVFAIVEDYHDAPPISFVISSSRGESGQVIASARSAAARAAAHGLRPRRALSHLRFICHPPAASAAPFLSVTVATCGRRRVRRRRV